MRRPWPWIICGAILIGVGLVVFLSAPRLGPPFMFLDGKAPIVPEEKTPDRFITTYTWRADWKKTARVAATELRARGFIVWGAEEPELAGPFGIIAGSRGEGESVMLSNDRLEYSNGKWTATDDNAWITAHIILSKHEGPSPIDRIKAIFGQ